MAPKRPLESEDPEGPATKKHRKGFRVGPGNLPDGPWKRKVDKIKKDLIHKAKVKKAYQKVKAAEQASSKHAITVTTTTTTTVETAGDRGEEEGKEEEEEAVAAAEPPSPQIHPERQAMLDDDAPLDSPPQSPADNDQPHRRRKQKPRRPGYFDKAAADAERKKAEAEERAQNIEQRNAERIRKTEERERFRKATAKARKPGRDGQRKLGRESGLLLEKVKRMVGDRK